MNALEQLLADAKAGRFAPAPRARQASLFPVSDNGNAAVSDNGSLAVSNTGTATTEARDILARSGVRALLVEKEDAAREALATLQALRDNGELWGLDIETMPRPQYRGDKKAGLDPYKSDIRTLQVYPGGDTCWVFDLLALGGLNDVKPLLTRPMVAHNAVFELKHLLRAGAAPRLDCSMLMANALRGDRPGLAALAADVLGWNLDKTLQVSDWGANFLTEAQRDYAALDAVAAYRLAAELRPKLDAEPQGRGRCYRLMADAQRAVARLELGGCPFDTEAHAALMARCQSEAEAARYDLDRLLGAVNPDSPKQLAAWLASNLPPEALETWPKTKTGALSTDADTLAGLTLPALAPLARYKAAKKMLSTYGASYAAHVNPETGRIHPDFLLGATATGRLACRNPNIQNPPRGEFRALFAPTEAGRCFVVADFGQIELRVAALVSGDAAMLQAYADGEDLHRKTAAAVLKVAPEAVSGEQRRMAKAVNFGLLFGQGARGLQRYAKASYGVNMTEATAKRARSAFFAAYPGLARWQKRQQEAAARAGQVRTPGGRVRPLEGDRQMATASLNTPIQGGAGECFLASIAALEPELDSLGAVLCNVVHDELVVECPEDRAKDTKAAVERAMVEGFLSVFPDGSTRDLVEAHAGRNWAEAKG
jgi:DNA polymerase-1